jgi:hypothetical protein
MRFRGPQALEDTYESPRKYRKQKTYAKANSFKYDTHRKPGVGATPFGDSTLFLSLFAPGAFHNSFAIKPFRTLSKKCRVSPSPLPTFLKNYFKFGGIARRFNHLQEFLFLLACLDLTRIKNRQQRGARL